MPFATILFRFRMAHNDIVSKTATGLQKRESHQKRGSDRHREWWQTPSLCQNEFNESQVRDPSVPARAHNMLRRSA